MTAVMQARLLTDVAYLFALRAVLDRLRSTATDPTLLPEDMS
jgi:hypothetical protein